MILPDVNVLVYAIRKDAAQHKICNDWLNSVVQGDARFGISPLALGAVVHVTTDQRVFATPSTSSEAFAFAAHLLAQPHCVPIQPGDRHWHIFERLCIETNTTGRRVTDAWYAALAIEWGCEWITFDRDFARFPGLKWQLPSSE